LFVFLSCLCTPHVGGRLGHYPIHFHLARNTSYTDAIIRDCSVHHSMTRFITIHGAQYVKLYRNVGYRSVGHGYFLEDGVETQNDLVGNLAATIRGYACADVCLCETMWD
jgi:hypothetical protein